MDAENERLKRVRLKKAHAEWWERQIERHESNLKSEARRQARLEENKRLTSDIFFQSRQFASAVRRPRHNIWCCFSSNLLLLHEEQSLTDEESEERRNQNKSLEEREEELRRQQLKLKRDQLKLQQEKKKFREQQLLNIKSLVESSSTKTTKSSSFEKWRSCQVRVEVLQVPSVAVPCGSSAPERSVFNNLRVQLMVWDTAGQERFRCMVPMYMRNASAAILVYDVTDRDSFDQIEEWHSEVMRCPTAVDEPTIVLIGNKADQNDLREVAEGEGVSKALRLNAHFFELSAVDTEVIRAIFNLVAEKIVHKCANVESAREADETMFESDSKTGEDVAGGESGDTSPVIRLGNDGGGGGWEPFRTELGEWARLISCRSWWGYSEKTATNGGGSSSCCSAL